MQPIDPKLKPSARPVQAGVSGAPSRQTPPRTGHAASDQQALDKLLRESAPALAKLSPQTAARALGRKPLAKRPGTQGVRPPVLATEPMGLDRAAAQQAADRVDTKTPEQHAAARTKPATTPITADELQVSPTDAGLEAPITHDLGGRPVALCHAQGSREEMEDSAAVRWFPESQIGVAAVFDGHGGDWVAQHAAELVPEHLEARLKNLSPRRRRDPQAVCAAIADAFAPADPRATPGPGTLAHALEEVGRGTRGGATAVVAVFVDKQLYVANLGDARAVLAHADGHAQRLSSDHRIVGVSDAAGAVTALDAETQRVLDQGGTLRMKGATLRLHAADGYALNMTRALGDLGYPGLGRRPDVNPVAAPAGSVLMLGCDGMFNRVHDDAHAAYITAQRQAGKSLAGISEDLIKVSHGRRSRDNMTTLLIELPTE